MELALGLYIFVNWIFGGVGLENPFLQCWEWQDDGAWDKREPSEASWEWQDDGAWDNSPMRDPKPPPLMEYLRPAPSGTPDPRGVRYAKFLSIQYFIDIDIIA